jgi:hypothetical protein
MRPRPVAAFLAVPLLSLALPLAPAGADPTLKVKVDCGKGQTIAHALEQGDARKPLVVHVQGLCAENVVVTRDDVTLQGPATVVAADHSLAVITLDGARRAVIDRLAVSGGADGIRVLRGATVEVLGCSLTGNARYGIVASFSASAVLDQCTITGNGPAAPAAPTGAGAVAANASQVVVTSSTITGNRGAGVIAARDAQVRVGQDFGGSPVPGPVTITGNAGQGITINDSSTAIVLGSTIEDNAGSGIAVNGASSAQIGIGIGNTASPNTVRNNVGNGIVVYQGSRVQVHGNTIGNRDGTVRPQATGVRVETAAATITANTIRYGARYGVEVSNSGGARIGLDDRTQGAGNLISDNGLEGVHVVSDSAVWMYGNVVEHNSTAVADRFGMMATEGSTIRMIGRNIVRQNGSGTGAAGIFLRASGLYVLRGDFTITPNDNEISDNAGNGVLAVENSTIDLRDAASVVGNAGHGLNLVHGSRARVQGTTITGNTGNAIQLSLGSTARLGPTANAIAGAIVCSGSESHAIQQFPPPTPSVPAGTCSGF